MTDTPVAPPPPREMVTELEIPDSVGPILANALPNWNPVAVSYVDGAGKPQLSFRGSVQRLNGKQLGMWARNPEGGMVKAMASRPNLSVLFADWFGGDADKRVFLSISGRGRIETSEALRRTIYDNMPQVEKDQDRDQKGVAIVMDVEEIMGLLPGKFLKAKAG